MLRKSFAALIGLLILLPARAAAQSERFEMGQRLRTFEGAWQTHKDPAARERALKILRGLVTEFFKGRFDEAARLLSDAGHALRSDTAAPAEVRWAQSLSVGLGRRLATTTLGELPVTLERFWKVEAEAPQGAALRLTLLAGDGKTVLASHEAPIARLPLETVLPLKAAAVAPGDHLLRAEILADGKVLAAAPEQTVSFAADLGERLAALQKGVRELPAPPTTTEVLTLRQLTGLLTALAAGRTLETNYPAARLLGEAESALKAVRDGKPYYGGGKTGQFWLRLAAGKTGTAARLLAPDAVRDGKPLPLVIALHGAGGSENLFFDGYGRGEIVRLCRERGWLLLAPRTEGFAFDVPAAALIDEVNRLYPVDRQRVFLVGHSMGAMQAIKAAQALPARPAGVAALGGGGSVGKGEAVKAVPFFVGAGTRDFLLSSARALKNALVAAGVETVVFREYAEVEHMLVVQVALPDVFALFDKAGASR